MIPARLSLAVLLLLAGAGWSENEVGWRGDGTGKYPATHPPTTWSRVSARVRGLRCQAARPGKSDTGAAMPDGVIREWLVLSPAPAGARAEKEILPGELELSPVEGEKSGDGVWKKAALETAWMDFNQLIGKGDKGIALACTNVFSDTGGKFRVNVTQLAGFQMILNGKPVPPAYGRYAIDLVKGWNRLLIKVAPRDSEWACTVTLHARAPADFETTNVAWMTTLPGATGGFYGGGTGVGSPVIAGGRLFLLSEPHDLICLNKADGKVLWIRTNSYFDAATDQDRKHPAWGGAEAAAKNLARLNASLVTGPLPKQQLEEKVTWENELYRKMQEVDAVRYKKPETPDVGFSGLTPVTDGRLLYLWLATGVTACYDLEGNRRWIRVDNLPAIEHGFSSSPLLVDGKIVIFMRDLIALDAATGNLAWQIPLVSHKGANPEGYFHGTPARAIVGGVPVIALGNGTLVRARDGKILSTNAEMGRQAISSPVVEGNLLLQTSSWGMKLYLHTLPPAAAEPFKLPTRTLSVDTPGFPRYYLPWHMASPVVHEGLAYLVNNSGVLTVIDVNEGKIVYQRMLDVDHFQTANEGPARGVGISPTLAGKRLYLFGNNGGAVVIEPGREFKCVAKNKLESIVSIGHWGERQERFVSNPVFDGSRLYLRGEGHLYAIDAQAGRGSLSRAEESRPAAPVSPPPRVARPSPPPTPEKEAVSPIYGWRRNGTGVFPGVSPPVQWDEKKNIKWRASVGAGNSSPVISGDRVFVLSEPAALQCLSRADGKLLWKATLDDALPEDLKQKARDPVGTRERGRATPVTDGKSIYVSLTTGIVAAWSVEGKRQWVQHVEPAALTYGPAASPVLAGDKLLVDSTHLTALEAATGRLLWKARDGEPHYGTPVVVSLDGIAFAITAKGAVIRVSDGEVLATEIAPGAGGDQAPTPVVRDGVAYFAYRRCAAVKLEHKDGKLRHEKLWEQELPGDVISSPVLKDGMLFVIPSGVPELRVLDQKTGEVLLARNIGLPGNLYPSLALAGNYLFLGNDKGDMLVLDPAPEYRKIHHNELPEGSVASPAFAGSHLFLRDGPFLYCIGP